jgi:hypothetical protein
MMRTRRSMSVGFLLMILGLLLPLPKVTADDGCKSPMKTSLTDLGPGLEGKATLCVERHKRQNKGGAPAARRRLYHLVHLL